MKEGAVDKSTKSIAEAPKNIVSAAYGGTITDKSRHQKTIICNEQQFDRLKFCPSLKDFTITVTVFFGSK